jgi:hypothetical protein
MYPLQFQIEHFYTELEKTILHARGSSPAPLGLQRSALSTELSGHEVIRLAYKSQIVYIRALEFSSHVFFHAV